LFPLLALLKVVSGHGTKDTVVGMNAVVGAMEALEKGRARRCKSQLTIPSLHDLDTPDST
jgi:hypothetical protein